MAFAAPVITTPVYTESYRGFENGNLKTTQSEKENSIETLLDLNSALSLGSDNKGLKSRVVVVLSNTFRNVAIIETTRFLAIIGLVCSAVASVLLPALGFAAIAAGACVLKNRAIQLDAKDLQGSAAATKEVFGQRSTRSESTASRTSEEGDNGSRRMSREGSIRSRRETPMGSIKEENAQEKNPTDIKEISFDVWAAGQKLNINQLHYLLNLSYSFLSDKKQDMPLYLDRKGSKNDTKKYLDQKIEHYSKEIQKKFPNLDNEGDSILGIENLEALRGALKNATPSSVMAFVKNLHSQISEEEGKWTKKSLKDHHELKAKHAEEYIAKLKAHEAQPKQHFTVDKLSNQS
ncbi:hypothetical protein [Candidatus Rhabdochlamydia sp. T3358]|uniref:hypothetical protein n=1 Tax=Candidatus Rhabdochlamydia sp. T3358 TaxID=2099795 RepID=UPI0010B07E67|nr:hypothetical protein [Candidatus Rhabdochlamydia sp. T3358]VHO03633.1 hypothetical protein RHT_00990 [Candidatus Rhabdochlamydia sp. T3358]